MKGFSYDDISLKDSYAAYDIDIDDLDFSDIDIPCLLYTSPSPRD